MVRTRGLHPRDKVADYQARGWWTDEREWFSVSLWGVDARKP